MTKKIIVSSTGCSLVDILFNNISFSSKEFEEYLSKESGDGGLVPGQLVFVEEFEKFVGEDHQKVIAHITGNRSHDKINIGGPSIVSIIHAAQLAFDKDCEFRFYGGRGNDSEGDFIMNLLAKTPVNSDKYVVINGETPYTLVLSDPQYNNNSGERIFINSIGVAWNYSPDMLDEDFFNSDIVVFGGTALVPQIHDNLTRLLQISKSKGCITVVNTVFDFRNEKIAPDKKWPLGNGEESYRNIDLLITDLEEALRLSGKQIVSEAIGFFRDNGVGALIITSGTDNVRMFSQGDLFQNIEYHEMPVSKAVIEELKKGKRKDGDTTGCGDNFVGGVLYSIVSQLKLSPAVLDLRDAVAWGVISGGTTTFYLGGMYVENKPGEKKKMIEPYYKKYLDQVKNKIKYNYE